MRVLLVEDEDEMARVLVDALEARGFVADRLARIDEAREALAAPQHDALILDRCLPDGDGLTLLADLRRRPSHPPVLVLTALDGTHETVAGLEAGADDYLVKPFEMDELVARLHALLRRPPPVDAAPLRLGALSYDADHRELRVHGEPLPLPRRETLILEALMRRAEAVVSRERLERAAYGFDDEVSAEAITPHVSRLRRRLEEREAGVSIVALRGIGYMLRHR